MATSDNLTSPIGLLSFPHLFTPRPPAPNAEPRYSCVLVFNEEAQKSEAFAAMKKALKGVIADEWGDKKPNNLRLPFRRGEEKAEYAGYTEGSVFMSAWSKQKPGIVDPRLQDILVPGDVWAGQLARVTFRFFTYSNSGNIGVSCGLNNVQICKPNMPRLDGRREASKDFDAVDATSDDDLVDGGDDDLPF